MSSALNFRRVGGIMEPLSDAKVSLVIWVAIDEQEAFLKVNLIGLLALKPRWVTGTGRLSMARVLLLN